jgi:glycerate 2-kinase
LTELAQIARAIFAKALKSVDLPAAVHSQLSISPDTIVLGGSPIPLSEVDEVITIAVGKAAAPMALAVQQVLQPVTSLRRRGIVVGPSAQDVRTTNIELFAGSHPLPDENSLDAARAALAMLATSGPRSAVLFLISGGASAMMEQPLDPSISLQDVATFYAALIGSGLSISRMNTLRKHISAVKGGRLAQAASAARVQLTLLVSDVPASTPEAVGSGPSVPDTTTLADCRLILEELLGHRQIPQSIRAFLTNSASPETPRADADCFARSIVHTILSSEDLAEAAATHAREAGFHVEMDNQCDEWEFREAAAYLLERSAAVAIQHPRSCLVSVGEVGVRLPPNHGVGGRNGHLALWCAQQAARRHEKVTILSAGSDGIDGNSQAAGAVCDETTAELADSLGFSADEALRQFDTDPLLRAIGASVVCGLTGNNLRDLRLLLRSS